MFLFDSDITAASGALKAAVFSEINSLGLNSFVDTDWYDFLADVDPAHVQRCRFAATKDIDASWADRLRIAYRLFLGRTPESARFDQEPQEFPELISGIVLSEEFLLKRSCIRFLRGPAFNARQKLIFLHVPRTGGTYFSAVLRNIAPLKIASCYDLCESTWMLDAAFATIFAAHFSRSVYRKDAGHRFVSMVRPPSERFFSRARYYGIAVSGFLSIPPVLLDEVVEGFQTRFIFGDQKEGCFPLGDLNTLVIPLEKVDDLVSDLYNRGLFKTAPEKMFRNMSRRLEFAEASEAVSEAVDFDDDNELYHSALKSFDIDDTRDRLLRFIGGAIMGSHQ